MLNKSEVHHSVVEKVASAIVEAVRKWAHFLSGRHFTIITDQKSVSCANMEACTVITCLNLLFALFEMPNYVHTDRAATFLSQELSSYFQRHGLVYSRTSAYNTPGNGQCERCNGIIWSAVRLALKSRKLDIRQWELLLPDALH